MKTLLLIRQGAARDLPLGTRQKVWQIKRRVPTPEKVKRALDLVQEGAAKAGAVEWTFAKETVMLDAVQQVRPKVEFSAGRQFANTGIELANQMRPGPVPIPPAALPFRAPWAYGNLPPELK